VPPRKRRSTDPPVFVDEHPEPWDRQPGEGDKAWRAFCLYRDAELPGGIGERLQRRVTEVMHPNARPTSGRSKEVCMWSARWRWVERARAFDAHLDKVKQEEFRAAIRADMDTNIQIYRAMRGRGSRALLATDPEAIHISHAIKMVETAITGLRREAGLATEITASERDNEFAAWLTRGGDPDDEDEPNGDVP
jgi:hypothetical protein